MADMRQAIFDDCLLDFANEFYKNYGDSKSGNAE
jgi:queuine/archaeosine tRNA-ribosyltransferase